MAPRCGGARRSPACLAAVRLRSLPAGGPARLRSLCGLRSQPCAAAAATGLAHLPCQVVMPRPTPGTLEIDPSYAWVQVGYPTCIDARALCVGTRRLGALAAGPDGPSYAWAA